MISAGEAVAQMDPSYVVYCAEGWHLSPSEDYHLFSLMERLISEIDNDLVALMRTPPLSRYNFGVRCWLRSTAIELIHRLQSRSPSTPRQRPEFYFSLLPEYRPWCPVVPVLDRIHAKIKIPPRLARRSAE